MWSHLGWYWINHMRDRKTLMYASVGSCLFLFLWFWALAFAASDWCICLVVHLILSVFVKLCIFIDTEHCLLTLHCVGQAMSLCCHISFLQWEQKSTDCTETQSWMNQLLTFLLGLMSILLLFILPVFQRRICSSSYIYPWRIKFHKYCITLLQGGCAVPGCLFPVFWG